ncbi:FxSxx-COOH system tetratricopeptide repeat protein [Solirubrobacter ginsenosidimutans]|uniref:FxSxx-COOH system tetratricopeptide repeat protein n=1 Tax=Solirubrobacter ginsenosidimutans TaxID=490573 RepID=A0A9X3N0A4_9ACTN|nr:FxSxx-COOH system tetratricopeptide repeat protein [Solirubrobacter ginsenosidimutans]MDA0166059.1 FxSxx-COOH system tetratricopeptide repeat protein [Solirubrobacter ginsenosidimutans]
MPAASPQIDFFVSYTQADGEWAEWIAAELEGADRTVFLQARHIVPGDNFVRKMDDALKYSDHVIAVLSDDYLASEFASEEWQAAFAADPVGDDRRLIPVKVKECTPAGLLRTRVHVDLVGLSKAGARDALLRGVGETPTRATSFPGSEAPRFPDASKRVSNQLPHPNRWFVGRDAELAAIEARLAKPGVQFVVLAGPAGVGKTQLAIEFAEAHRDRYELVWWAHAGSFAADLAALGDAVGAPRQLTVQKRAGWASGWLERRDRWLLVVDDVDDPARGLELLPRAGAGDVLVTARADVGWPGGAEVPSVDVLGLDGAAQYLQERSGEHDAEAAAALAAELGRLPLALEQAAAFIAETGPMSLAALRLELQARPKAVLAATGAHNDIIATIWSQSRELMPDAAIDLISLTAFLAADDVPYPLLTNHAHVLPEPLASCAGDRLQLAATIRTLRRYGVAKAVTDGIAVHRLLQTVVRASLPDDARDRWATVAGEFVQAAVEALDPPGRPSPAGDRLLPHVLAYIECVPGTSVLLLWAAEYTKSRGDFRGARSLFERVGPTLHARCQVAFLTGRLGEHERAIRLYEQLLPDQLLVFGPDHEEMLGARHNIARFTGEAGRLDEALEQLAALLIDSRRALGPDHERTLGIRHGIAYFLGASGHEDEALEQFATLLADHERVVDEDHADTLGVRGNIARLLGASGRHADAVEHLAELVPRFARVHGADHPDTLGVRHELQYQTEQAGRHEEAQRLLRELREDEQRIFGQSLSEERSVRSSSAPATWSSRGS